MLNMPLINIEIFILIIRRLMSIINKNIEIDSFICISKIINRIQY